MVVRSQWRNPNGRKSVNDRKSRTELNRSAFGGRGLPKAREKPKARRERFYALADLEAAERRLAAAERRVENDRSSNPDRSRGALAKARLQESIIRSQLKARGLLL